VAEGYIDVTAEAADVLPHVLPNGVTIVRREPFGGAVRLTVQGSEIEMGKGYQMVVVTEPMRRSFELKKSPHQEATDVASADPVAIPSYGELLTENERLAAEVAKVDGDGDGRVGGSKARA